MDGRKTAEKCLRKKKNDEKEAERDTIGRRMIGRRRRQWKRNATQFDLLSPMPFPKRRLH